MIHFNFINNLSRHNFLQFGEESGQKFDGSDYRADLEAVLRTGDHVGNFAFSGRCINEPLPGIEIRDIGRLQYPFSEHQASAIIGIGNTLDDQRLHKTWQIDTKNFEFTDRVPWLSVFLPRIVRRACQGLGVTASLNKMFL